MNISPQKLSTPIDPPIYIIGVDCYDEDNPAYCLLKITGKISEIVLCKTVSKDDFDKEVEAVFKIFNAKILK